MGAPISLPAAFVGLRTHGAFLAVADCLQPVRRNSQLGQEVARGSRTAVTEAQVIFGGSALITVPFHIDGGVGEVGEYALQGIGVARERGARIVANIVRIVIIERVPQIRLNARLQRAPVARSVPYGRGWGRGTRYRDGRGGRGIAGRACSRSAYKWSCPSEPVRRVPLGVTVPMPLSMATFVAPVTFHRSTAD